MNSLPCSTFQPISCCCWFFSPHFSEKVANFDQTWHRSFGCLAWFDSWKFFPIQMSIDCTLLSTASRLRLGLVKDNNVIKTLAGPLLSNNNLIIA